jgi:ABC-type phosphate transport system substrate-binding protein
MSLMALTALALLASVSACDRHGERDEGTVPSNAPPVRVDGSSTVYLISKAVGEELAKQHGSSSRWVNPEPPAASTLRRRPGYLWVVLRDSRGGGAFTGHAVTIAP